MMFQDALEGYWFEKRRILSPATVREYTPTFQRFCDYIGEDFRFERIAANHIRVSLEVMKGKRLSPKSVTNCWAAFSSL